MTLPPTLPLSELKFACRVVQSPIGRKNNVLLTVQPKVLEQQLKATRLASLAVWLGAARSDPLLLSAASARLVVATVSCRRSVWDS